MRPDEAAIGPQNPRRRTRGILVATLLAAAATAHAQDARPRDPALGPARPDRPLSPAEALATFALPAGYRIQLVAAEPMVMDPVAIAFDADGRLFVAEMADYPFGPPRGRIKRLEDTDGDGRMDKVTTFATEVQTPLGLLPWKNGVLVAAAPDILFLEDQDGDGRSDRRTVWLTGFVEGNPQHRVNGLVLGIDNWIYGANGDSGGRIRKPGEPAAAGVSIRGTDFRFRPDLSAVQTVAGQSQYANTFDDWGRRFINSHSNHVVHPVLPLHYLGRNAHLSVSAVQDAISDHGPSARVFPKSRLEERYNDAFAAGHFTSASAITIYRGEMFPPDARGNAFVCEPVHNLVHRDVLVPAGASFSARRAPQERESEFLTSTDLWFRPVNLATGPDGALYVVDFYRAVIEHPEWIPLEVQRRIDLRAGEDRGRIWRIVHGEGKAAGAPRLGSASTADLVAALAHPNGWWRGTAQRLLLERRDGAATPALERLYRTSRDPLARVHALWTLEGLGALSPALVRQALGDRNEAVREHALRLAEPWLRERGPGAVKARALALAADRASRVRFQAAFSLGELPAEERVAPLARIAARDAADRWVRAAVLSSAGGIEQVLVERLLRTAPALLAGPAEGALELVAKLGEMVAARRDPAALAAWLRLGSTRRAELPRWRRVALTALAAPLARAGVAPDREALGAAVVAAALAAAQDETLPPAERVAAVELLAWVRAEGAPEPLLALLTPKQPTELQVAVARGLVTWPGDALGGRLLAGWSSASAGVRRELLRHLIGRPERTDLLVGKLESGDIAVAELGPEQREKLLADDRPAIRQRARKIFEARSSAQIEQVTAKVTARVLALRGDRVRGEKVYMNACAPCHRLNGQGHKLGPGLESVATRDASALMSDILNPNRALDPAFQMYAVKTPTEESITGVIAAETPSSVTLRRPLSDETTILRKDIVEMKAWPTSMMPEGFEQSLNDQDLADLLALLRGGARP